MAPKSPAETTQTTKVDLPGWVEKASKSNYNFAKDIVDNPKNFQVYKGDRVAETSNMTTDAYKYLMNNVGAQDPLFKNAADIQARAATELDPIYAKAQGILSDVASSPFDPTSYLNPYTAEVENRAISNADRQLQQQLMAQSDKAKKAGAFGGTASSIERGVLAAEGARGIGDLSAELRRAGYDKATADMMADRAMKTTSANSMISGAATQGQGWLDSATGMLATAGERGKSVLADTSAMMAAGQNEQDQRQSLIDADMGKFYEKRDKNLDKLNILLSSLGMSPYGKTETVNKTATSESQGPDFATMGLGIAQMLMPLLSDRRDKKDIEHLYDDEETGVPIFAYRYKDQDEDTPLAIGPMAQDIEKKFPKAVIDVGGHKVVAPLGILA